MLVLIVPKKYSFILFRQKRCKINDFVLVLHLFAFAQIQKNFFAYFAYS